MMQTMEWHWQPETFELFSMRPKSEWGPGEWEKEPDKKQWEDEKTGYPCLIVRGSSGGLCGYAGVVQSHPAYEIDYDTVLAEVHGGLTFSGFCQEFASEGEGICHIPGPGEPDRVWWLGFDSAHGFDLKPAIDAVLKQCGGHSRLGGTYRTIGYVEAQVAHLARQLKEMEAAIR